MPTLSYTEGIQVTTTTDATEHTAPCAWLTSETPSRNPVNLIIWKQKYKILFFTLAKNSSICENLIFQ